MSAELQPSVLQSFGLFKNNGASVLQNESPLRQSNVTEATTGTRTREVCRQQRFHTLSLDELSEELDRRTKETQRLQNEVEHATKLTLERFGCTYSTHSSPGKSSHSHSSDVYNSPGNSSVLSTPQQQASTQPLVCDLESLSQTGAQEEALERVIDDCLQQLSDLQLSKTPDLPEQQTFTVDRAIMNLQTRLQEVQLERDALSDLRLKDSRTHVHQMEKMLCMLEELQSIKRAGDQKLRETEEETMALNQKVATLERNLEEMYNRMLSDEKQHGQDFSFSNQLNRAADLTEGSRNVTNKLQEGPFLSQEHLGSGESRGANKPKERIEDLIACLGQEMVLLTDKLSSSQNDSASLSVKLQMLKGLAERHTSLQQCQVRDLESTICSHKDQVRRLEQQLLQAQSQLVDAKRDRERSLLQAEELQSRVCQLQRCGEQQQCELQEEVKVLRGQLEAAREQLQRGGEERSCLQVLLEQRAQEGRKSQELLQEKTRELQQRLQETQQFLVRLEVAQTQNQILQAEEETLRLQLDDRDRKLEDLRLEMESSIQMSAQHSCAINNLQQENSLLSNRLNQHKQDMEQLRAELEQKKSELAAADQERRRFKAAVEEQSQRVQEETLKKQQLSKQLLTLTEEHRQLQQLHIRTSEEHEGAALELQSQLRNTHKELDRVRSVLRTLEGADGHGLQVAMEMQRKITARREQIDSLQGKIQHLEETVEKLQQEKRQQSLQHQQQLQDLTFIREEKRQLRCELEVLRSKDKQLRERISQLEAILHKMSESFADCQDFIQLQEQDFFRLKLQHALDLKELQGQNVIASKVPPPDPGSPSSSGLPAPPSSQHASNAHVTKESPPVRMISGDHRPHTEHTAARCSFLRRRSAPEKEHVTTADKDKAASRLRRKTCGSKPHVLNGKTVNGEFSSDSRAIWSPAVGKYSSSLQILSLGRRSPVHCLLTSDPHCHQ
ncbi:coiled-coil domain-containing protein 158-like [Halichoeres trimaculatus]|uniref:coiled-coil domain-containing protein 158-like n=1 Tax=Halichoeres trimaculatus TaxID=147232 RepID=UPI003D9DB469